MRGKAKLAADGLDAMLNAVYEWEAKVDAFVATGSDEDDVVVTHDSRGRLIELWVRPGLQQELTTEELEDRINDAITGNAQRARDGMNAIKDEFLAKWSDIPKMLANHPVALQMSQALGSTLDSGGK